MNKCENTKSIISITIKFMIFICAFAGVMISFSGDGFMSSSLFLYFTIQSNIWIGCICLVFAIIEIVNFKKTNFVFLNWLLKLKYIFTVAITLTFLVFSIMLTPQMIMEGNTSYLWSMGNILLHNLVPILAIVDFCIFDFNFKTNKLTFLYGLIMPLYYFIFAVSCSLLGADFGDGAKVPYFFMDFYNNGWFKIGNGRIGCFYWAIIVFSLVALIGFVLVFVKNKIAKRQNKLII